ncbi:MAG: hypothetical protein OQK51_17535 [Kangiellaceae bacterium]|nr:hypothetical protein [Kangiellaceae bacterium]
MDIPTAQTSDFDNLSKKSWSDYLPVVLRGLGAAAVLISLYTFIVKGWQSSDDLARYLTLLGHTALLGIIGFVNGKLIKEAKGARVLFMLALASIPVNFSVLGGLLYSSLGLAPSDDIPSFLSWYSNEFSAVLGSIVAASVITLPICLIGFKILIRQVSVYAASIFILSNLLLLAPIRESFTISLVAIGMSFLLMSFYHLSVKKMLIFQTFEGKVCYAILFSPILILLGRNLWLYQLDHLLVFSSSVALFLLIRQVNSHLSEISLPRSVLEFASLILAASAAANFGYAISELVPLAEIKVVTMTYLCSYMIYDLSKRGELRAATYRIIAAMVFTVGSLLIHSIHESIVTVLMLMVSTGVLSSVGIKYKQKILLICAVVVLLVLSGHVVSELMFNFDFSYWLVIAGAGILLIVCGSLIEAKADLIKSKLANYKHRFSDWHY